VAFHRALINGFVQFARNVVESKRRAIALDPDTALRRMESTADNPQLVTLTGSPLLNQVVTPTRGDPFTV
jgi:hypothetical protein